MFRPASGPRKPAVKPGGLQETASFDISLLLGKETVDKMLALKPAKEWRKSAEEAFGFGQSGKDVELTIQSLSAHGDGLAVLNVDDQPSRIVAVPFALPGERVTAHIARHEPDVLLSHADLLSIQEPSPDRLAEEPADEPPERTALLKEVRQRLGNRVQCQYFGKCSGCQYQPLSYEKQLEIKQNVIRKAFANFSGLDPELIPSALPTLPSPRQYEYRTKLTPHFQAPPQKGKETNWQLTIGFEEKNRKRIIDIEECPIATRVINDALPKERHQVQTKIDSYKRGATILLRDSLPPRPKGSTRETVSSEEPHICITDHHATVREQVALENGQLVEYEQQAGSFFQNNNSILPSLISYISSQLANSAAPDADKTYLVDAYCGSGLFALALADKFDEIKGVEIDRQSVKWATHNATFNDAPGRGKVSFIEGQAEAIFKDINFPALQTTVIIDPPRKGCDEAFLDQLLAFGPRTIVYVSCNVHTQARDVGYILNKSQDPSPYVIKSIRAADLFPNTHHAEGIAILHREN